LAVVLFYEQSKIKGFEFDMATSVQDDHYPEDWKVVFQPSKALPENYALNQSSTMFEQGKVCLPSAKPVVCDTIKNEDVSITLRDGTVIYADVFRPANQSTPLPVLVNLSSYGKTTPVYAPNNVPKSWFTGLGKFEAADAGIFTAHGYVIVNTDNRGAYKSGGNIHYWGLVDAMDGYDVVEWAAQQVWSSGKVATFGSSWLAISQWFIAALKPPHLSAIVPWNGFTDLYRDSLVWGGIPDTKFAGLIADTLTGEHQTERIDVMAEQYPLMNPYWADKRARLEEVTVPAYIVADGTSILHTLGTLEGARRIQSKEKWLRINDTQEWYDMYEPSNVDDVIQFLDYYLKGVDNSWPSRTPKVRVAVMDPGSNPTARRETKFTDWPIPETVYTKYYLDSKNGSLSQDPVSDVSYVTYDATTGNANFSYTFTQDAQIIGYTSLRLYVEAQGATDMDLFVSVEKIDEQGIAIRPRPGTIADMQEECIKAVDCVPAGPAGRLRVSLRDLDDSLSTSFWPVHSFTQPKKLTPGEIVAVDIGLLPRAHFFHAGQRLRLTVRGSCAEHDVLTINEGKHLIHTGGGYQAYLQLPLVPLE
jgi:predicted acyl esterase